MSAYEIIKELYVQLNANAVSMFTNLGDGKHELLRLIVSDAAQYKSVTAVPSVSPANPGVVLNYSNNANSTRIKQADDTHGKAYILFKKYTLVERD